LPADHAFFRQILQRSVARKCAAKLHHAIFKISGTMLWEVAGSVEAADDMPIAVSDNMASSDDQWLDINHLSFCDAYT
jgi:hypothetical protein